MSKSKLFVNEIFQSLQGEGFHVGTMATFIRFAGCNLSCSFCDTKYSREVEDGSPMSPDEIVRAISELSSSLVVLTGGEPLTQNYEALSELITLLDKDLSINVIAIETNGSIDFDFSHLSKKVWVTVSPKQELLFKMNGNELKLLYSGKERLENYERMDFDEFFLQPILPNSKDLFLEPVAVQKQAHAAFAIVFEVLKLHPKWRLSPQLHKLVGIR